MKKVAFSVLLASSISFALAQDVAKETKTTRIELNRSSEYDIIDNKPIIIKGEAIIVKEGTNKKGETPVTKPTTVKAVSEPIPVKGSTDNDK